MENKKGGHPAGIPGGPGGARPGAKHQGGGPGGTKVGTKGGGHPAGIPGGPGAKPGGGHPGGGHPGGPGGGDIPIIDTTEKGAVIDGKRQKLDRRLYMQFLVFGNADKSITLINELKEASFHSVLYRDMMDPHGVGLLTMHEDPDFFVNELRFFLQKASFGKLELKEERTMFGRTYALGHEQNLKDWLIDRPPRVVCDPKLQWGVWYPLRRTGEFATLLPKEQGEILMEHGRIGRAFGKSGLGHDIRLNCNGLDKDDADFVIGLIGPELHPLSLLVQTMRATRQTSEYVDKMGPFFIGKAVWQSHVDKGGE